MERETRSGWRPVVDPAQRACFAIALSVAAGGVDTVLTSLVGSVPGGRHRVTLAFGLADGPPGTGHAASGPFIVR